MKLFILSIILFCHLSVHSKLVLSYTIEQDTISLNVPEGKTLLEIKFKDENNFNLGFEGIEINELDDHYKIAKLVGEVSSSGRYSKVLDTCLFSFMTLDPRISPGGVVTYNEDGRINVNGYHSVYVTGLELKNRHHMIIVIDLTAGLHYVADKPVIYLYPEKEQTIKVKIQPKGELTFTYPEYKDGWEFNVTPNGVIKGENREYYYLFWEGNYTTNLLYGENRDKGFVIKGSETQMFFEKTLPKMGLSPSEYNEFIVYWTPLMKDNKYNFIHFKFNEVYDEEIAGISITPKPDNIFRVFMVFEPLYSPRPVEAQEIPKLNRDGFTVVEWGGTEYKTQVNFTPK